MSFFFNDLSLHGQFNQLEDFRCAIALLMQMRQTCSEFGFSIFCDSHITSKQVTKEMNMQQAIQQFDVNQRRDLMTWITKTGPFWSQNRSHPAEEYLECHGEVLTDSALGEASFYRFHGQAAEVVSLRPSNWEATALQVLWTHDDQTQQKIDIVNHIQIETLEKSLRSSSKPIDSWSELQQICLQRFTQLIFTEEAFSPLIKMPFISSAANAIVERLDILNHLKTLIDKEGLRSPEVQELKQKYFMGDKAWFSGSTDKECRIFKNEMTFKHPECQAQTLFCPWHGKVKPQQIRIHFSWPVKVNEALYVVYVGPKITRG